MAAAKKAPPKTKAKAEARAAHTSSKLLDEGLEQMSGLKGMFGEYAEDGMKAIAKQAADSTEIIRKLGARNMDFFTRTLEQGVEATQSLTSAKDPREVMEIQTGFAKSLFSAYTSEMSAQADICMSAWRNAAKPFMAFAGK